MNVLLHISASQPTCTNLENSRIRNKEIMDVGIDIIEHSSVVDCAAECKLRNKCTSFSFQRSNGKCKLFGITIEQAGNSVATQVGTDIQNIVAWPSRIAGPCANHNCLSTDICEPTSQSSVQCVTVYCPSIPNVLHAKADFITTYETTKVGSQLSYTCDVNFHPVGNRTCLPNGTWSDFRCEPDCPAPPPVANAVPAYTGQPNSTVGTVLSYTCNTFYEPAGEMRCLAGGIWSNFTCSGGCPTDDGYTFLESPALCFKIVLDKNPYAVARDACIQSGSRLIVLDTPEKNAKIINYFTSHNFVGYFLIGLTDKQKEGVFVWENGVVAEFTKWEPGEPNNRNGYENCVVLKSASLSWFDTLCATPRNYICEKQP
ncbi:aggrecan core protein-like [Gigantopelta aegis]|uniref:aggrecan core protein-like n=1 Tax=Gigantopelta aegis TaxID=1735272 RepID=UPI001B88C60A|nr:aggrecan core protein-like [Gigantopelta aegis]